jgi:hypothetical protein
MSTEPSSRDPLAELVHESIKLGELRSHNVNRSSISVVHVSAGSWMAVILMFAAAFVLGIALATSFDVSGRMTKIEGKQDEQDQYLHAIYMMAPQLKPKEKTDEQH